MCIIVCCPAGKFLKAEALRKCWNNNPDGAGYMFSRGKKLYIKKGYFDFNDFLASYTKDFKRTKSSQFILHFRIATHGGISPETCHPFVIHDDLAFVHNGTISAQSKNTEKGISDTMAFRDNVLNILPPGFLDNDGMCELIEEYASNSKYAFMDSLGNVTILNKHLGNETTDGFWMSNTMWKTMRVKGYKRDNERWDYKTQTWVPVEPNKSVNTSSIIRPKCTACKKVLVYTPEIKDGKCYSCKSKYLQGYSRGRSNDYAINCSHCEMYLSLSERSNDKSLCDRCADLDKEGLLGNPGEVSICSECEDKLVTEHEFKNGRCGDCQDIYDSSFVTVKQETCMCCLTKFDNRLRPVVVAPEFKQNFKSGICTECFLRRYNNAIMRTVVYKGLH